MRGFDLQWPSIIQNSLNVFARITDSQDSFFSFDCIFIQLGLTGLFEHISSSYYIQMILMGVTPFLMSLLSIPFWLCINSKKKRKELQEHIESEHHQPQQIEDPSSNQYEVI